MCLVKFKNQVSTLIQLKLDLKLNTSLNLNLKGAILSSLRGIELLQDVADTYIVARQSKVKQMIELSNDLKYIIAATLNQLKVTEST